MRFLKVDLHFVSTPDIYVPQKETYNRSLQHVKEVLTNMHRWQHVRPCFCTCRRTTGVCQSPRKRSSNSSAIFVVSDGVQCSAVTCLFVNCIKLMISSLHWCLFYLDNSSNMRFDGVLNGYSRRLLKYKRASNCAFVCL